MGFMGWTVIYGIGGMDRIGDDRLYIRNGALDAIDPISKCSPRK